MKKIISLICVISLMLSFILSIPSTTYGVCNIVRLRKDVSAVQLILSNGQMLHNLRFKRAKATSAAVYDTFKTLKFVFVVNTNDSDLDSSKDIIKDAIDRIFKTYEEFTEGEYASGPAYTQYSQKIAEKLNIAILPFNGMLDGEGGETPYDIFTTIDKNIGKDNAETKKESIKDKVDKLEQEENSRSLEDAIKIVQASTGGIVGGTGLNPPSDDDDDGDGDELRIMGLVTGGNMNCEEEHVAKIKILVSDTINSNMISVYHAKINPEFSVVIPIGVDVISGTTIEKIKNDFSDKISEGIKTGGIKIQELFPDGTYENVLVTPDQIQLICENELLYGATLRIEYAMYIELYTKSANQGIQSGTIKDTISPYFSFSLDEPLITEPNKTNAFYGWEFDSSTGTIWKHADRGEENGEVIFGQQGLASNPKIVLTTLLPGNDEQIYNNLAVANISYNRGDKDEGVTLRRSALEVSIVPPTGENNSNAIYIAAAMTVGFIVIAFVLKAKIKKEITLDK